MKKAAVAIVLIFVSVLCVYYFYKYDQLLEKTQNVKIEVPKETKKKVKKTDFGTQVKGKEHIGELEYKLPSKQWYFVSNLVDSNNGNVIGKVYRNYTTMSEVIIEEQKEETQNQMIQDCEDEGYERQGDNPLIYISSLRIEVFMQENGKRYGVSYKTFSNTQDIAYDVESIVNSRNYNKKLDYEKI